MIPIAESIEDIEWIEQCPEDQVRTLLPDRCRAIKAHLERLAAMDAAHDPLSEAYNSGDGVYRP